MQVLWDKPKYRVLEEKAMQSKTMLSCNESRNTVAPKPKEKDMR